MTTERNYSEMSPIELNGELAKIIEMMPYSATLMLLETLPDEIPAKLEEVKEIQKNRKASEAKKMLMNRLEELLSFARVTDSFGNYIKREFDAYFGIGVIKNASGKVISGGISWILDEDKPDGGGIFSKDRAKYLEIRGYAEYVDLLTGLWELEKSTDSIKYSELLRDVRSDQLSMRQWQEEYSSSFGNDIRK